MTSEPIVASDPAVIVEKRGSALWLRLNRPETMNGMNDEILTELHRGLDTATDDPDIRSVVITGTGKAFCAGADLGYARYLRKQTSTGRHSPGQLFLRRVRELLERLESFDKPTVAAIQGVTVGGGLELVLCCDLALAARTARIGDGHANYAQIPGGGGSVRLARRLGLSRAKYLMFTGYLMPAEFYIGTDLLIDVVDDDELESKTTALTDTLGAKSPVGLARMKQLANDAFDTPQPIALGVELEHSALHEHSSDWSEGMAAFAEKRKPIYTGR